jgi:hypothetical protein
MLLQLALACAPPPLPTPDTTPSISITWPLPETEIQGCTTVAVAVENFEFVDFTTNGVNAEGQGHWHVFHPAGYAATWVPFQFVDWSTVKETTDPYLTVQLANNDHSDVLDDSGQPISASIPFTFVPGPCEATGDADTEEYDTGDTGDTGGGG